MELAHRQQKIQEKRKQTPFRDFVMEVCSWFSLSLYRIEEMITRYPNTERKWIIVPDQYASMNNEDIGEYTGDFFSDFARFYEQSKKSSLIFFGSNENADYTSGSFGAKNCYLCFDVGLGVENVLYSVCVNDNCANVGNSFFVENNSDNVFESKSIRQSFNIFYSANIDNSSDMRFCTNCVGCHFCINCDNLVNQSYCIDNQQVSKEEYLSKTSELLKDKSLFPDRKFTTFAKMANLYATNATGGWIINSEDIENGYCVFDGKNCRNVVAMVGGKQGSANIYDSIDVGNHAIHNYAVIQRGKSEHIYCCIFGGTCCSNCYYSMNLETCSFCFWCIGLMNKSYCIFNKQYTKEERYVKVNEIFTQMEKDWTLWQFFPATMNPFYFNDTAAYLIDPTFTKEEVEKAGYLRRDEPIKVDIPADAELVNVHDLDKYEGYDENGKRNINEEILKKVIIDEQGNVRRIVNMEYAFLMKHGLPLPRKHRLERMKENFKIG